MNYTEALNYIHSLGNFKLPAGLQRITAALSALSCPQNKFDAIHIAGTNGKGSVSAMLAKIFETAGFKTGLYISPYIIDFRERIQINGNFISEDDLIKYSQRVKNSEITLSEFEFITAAAFSYFADEKCDIVIAETGLGGRLDATNTLERVRAAVITKIGLCNSRWHGRKNRGGEVRYNKKFSRCRFGKSKKRGYDRYRKICRKLYCARCFPP